MQFIFTRIKIKFISNKALTILLLVAFFGFLNCTENSDKIVSDSLETKQFEVDQINLKTFTFESSKLVESVVLVQGIIQDINYLNNRSTIILKGKRDGRRLVICDMQDNQKSKIKNLNLGDELSVKGILKGTLNDIILLHCIIPQQKTNE